MHRQSSVAFVCGFLVAMGILVLVASAERAREMPPLPEPAPTFVRSAALPAPPEPPPIVEVAKAAYTGNVKTRKFHRLSCRHADCPNCTARLATREEAIAAGFVPCGTCRP